MRNNHFAKVVILFVICFSGINACFAATFNSDFAPIKTINPDGGSNVQNELNIQLDKAQGGSKTINLSENDTFYHFVDATDRFVQCNIRASWEDFRTLINNTTPNDFVYISLANKMADLGLFDLANLAVTKIQDNEIAGVSIDAMKRFYYPRKKIKTRRRIIFSRNLFKYSVQ